MERKVFLKNITFPAFSKSLNSDYTLFFSSVPRFLGSSEKSKNSTDKKMRADILQLNKVAVVPPPDKQFWMSLSDNSQQSWMKKESILTDLYIKQTSAVQQCNASLQEIKEWRQKQIDNYKQKQEAKSP
jgi:hypothetical protein